MARCNLDLMAQFTCDELREKRIRAGLNIAEDQRLADHLNAQIRQKRILIENRRAEIRRLRNEVPSPSLPGPVERDDERRPKKPSISDVFTDTAEEIARQIRNRQEIRRLENDISRYEGQIQRLLPQYADRLRLLNGGIDSRGCITEAMRRKGCIGA